MDEMALLEQFRSDVDVDHASLIRARRRVLTRALADPGAGRRRRRSLILAVAAAVAVVDGIVTITGGGPTATPAAAAVLSRAAEAADGETQPAPDEYLHVREITTRWDVDGEETTVQEHWIPGDADKPRIFRDFDGFVYLEDSPLPGIFLQGDLSTEAMLEWLRRPNGDLRGDDAAYERAGEVLASDVAPADFQATLFDALQHIDGVTVIDEDARFGDRDVVIIGRGGPSEAQFAFDQRSGLLVGMQGVGDPDVGTPLSYRTITTTSITDRLPARATRKR